MLDAVDLPVVDPDIRLGIVATIGPETELGRISTLAQTVGDDSNPLERRLDKLGETLVAITLALSTLPAAGFD